MRGGSVVKLYVVFAVSLIIPWGYGAAELCVRKGCVGNDSREVFVKGAAQFLFRSFESLMSNLTVKGISNGGKLISLLLVVVIDNV